MFQMLVVERKTFLTKQRLEYIAKFRLDDASEKSSNSLRC